MAAPASTSFCAEPVSPALRRAILGKQSVHVGVFGDSFGIGIWWGLKHILSAHPQYVVDNYSKESTGFTRYRSLNVEDEAQKLLRQHPVQIAVISFGANDTQPIYKDGKLLPYMSDGWKKVVGARARGLVSLLRDNGAAVYWVGLPRMREAEFDQQVRSMNQFYAGLMGTLQVPYISTEPLSIDAGGRYADYLPEAPAQEPRLMRAPDGKHMSMIGYLRISRPLANQIENDLKIAVTNGL